MGLLLAYFLLIYQTRDSKSDMDQLVTLSAFTAKIKDLADELRSLQSKDENVTDIPEFQT